MKHETLIRWACVVLSSTQVTPAANHEPPLDEIHQTEVSASVDPLIAPSRYQLWIPANAPTIRCLFVINQRAAGKHLFFQDTEWRALAKQTNSAMMLCEFYLMGAEDAKPKDIREDFYRSRRAKSPRAWIWLPGQKHWPKGMGFDNNETTTDEWRVWAANDVVIPWTKAIIELRLPQKADSGPGPVELRDLEIEKGWLGEIKTGKTASYREFENEKSTASWLPNEAIAKAWSEFSFPPKHSSKDRAS